MKGLQACKIIFVWMFIGASYSCAKEAGVEADTVLITSLANNDILDFDTVTVGHTSPVKMFKIFNYNKYAVLIDKIELAGGAVSPFKINLNGENGISFKNIDLPEGDSMYIFVNVTLPPALQAAPSRLTDSLGIFFNARKRNIIFTAMGRLASE